VVVGEDQERGIPGVLSADVREALNSSQLLAFSNQQEMKNKRIYS
jgi:hypothetical protein